VPNLPEDRKNKIKNLANAISTERDCDVLIYNFGFEGGFDLAFLDFLKKRETKRDKLLLFLISEGGDAHCAYRVARHLQENYKWISVAVSGWCKSAGTLVCIGANELILFDSGELGPLDVQIAKTDEVGEQSSGLAAVAAFDKLQQEAFKMFERHLRHIFEEIPGRISFRTAADISAELVIGTMRDIFAKIEPMSVGEDYRSNLITEEYAIRLNLFGRNLEDRREPKGLDMLLNGYPSHRFVIDRKEASKLFRNVSAPSEAMITLAEELGTDAILPRNPLRNQQPRLEYLDDAASQRATAKARARPKRPRARSLGQAGGARAGDISGSVPASTEQEARRKSAA
jgi:hypothetical protein